MSWLLRSGHVRLVKRTMAISASRSIHNEQPLYPRCPIERLEKWAPADEFSEGVSQPNARELPAGPCRSANRSSVWLENNLGLEESSSLRAAVNTDPAKRSRSGTLEKTPACPATPFNTHAFSSCTSPWMRRWRKP